MGERSRHHVRAAPAELCTGVLSPSNTHLLLEGCEHVGHVAQVLAARRSRIESTRAQHPGSAAARPHPPPTARPSDSPAGNWPILSVAASRKKARGTSKTDLKGRSSRWYMVEPQCSSSLAPPALTADLTCGAGRRPSHRPLQRRTGWLGAPNNAAAASSQPAACQPQCPTAHQPAPQPAPSHLALHRRLLAGHLGLGQHHGGVAPAPVRQQAGQHLLRAPQAHQQVAADAAQLLLQVQHLAGTSQCRAAGEGSGSVAGSRGRAVHPGGSSSAAAAEHAHWQA